MIRKMKFNFIIGLIIWGFSVFVPELSFAGPLTKGGAIGAAAYGADELYLRGMSSYMRNDDEAAKNYSEFAGYKNNENIRAVTDEDVKNTGNLSSKAAMVYKAADDQTFYLNAHMETIGGVMDGCVPLPLKLEQNSECVLCPLFNILFNSAQTLSIASYNTLAEGFKNLLLIGFALYVAFVSLKQVSSFTRQDAPKYISDLLVMSFKVLLAYLILLHIDQLYDLVLVPLLKTGMEFGSAFLYRSTSTSGAAEYCNLEKVLSDSPIAEGYFDKNLFAQLNCFVASVQQELSVATSVGSSMMCVARNEAANDFGFWDLNMFTSGLVIWVFSWITCIAFAFYLVDAVVRLGIVGGLMPFLVAAWPFKITSNFTKKGWEMFLNTFFIFAFLGMVVTINIELAMQAMSGGKKDQLDIPSLISNNDIESIIDIMGIGFIGLLFLILCCIFGFKLCSEVVNLAAQLGAGSGGTIGSNIASGGAALAKLGTVGAAHVAGKGMYLAGEYSGVNDSLRTVRDKTEDKIFKFFGRSKGSNGGNGGGSSGGSSGGNGGGRP